MTDPTKQRSSSAIWIAALVVVVLLGVVAVIATRSNRSEETDAQDARQTSEIDVGGGEGTTQAGASTVALPMYDATTADTAVGMTIPEVTGQDFAGDPITIGPDGTAKVILFVAHWCPHCQAEIPLLQDHLQESPMPDDVELVTVSTSVKPGAENYPPEEWLARESWEGPVLADDELGTVAQQFGLSAFPYFVAVDADGKVVQRATGELTTEAFDALVSAAGSGEAA